MPFPGVAWQRVESAAGIDAFQAVRVEELEHFVGDVVFPWAGADAANGYESLGIVANSIIPIVLQCGPPFIKTSTFRDPWLQPRGGENGCPQAVLND